MFNKKTKERIDLYEGLAGLLSSGIPLMEGLNTIAKRSSSRFAVTIAQHLQRELGGGTNLRDALLPIALPEEEKMLIIAAQQAGNLSIILQYLSEKLKKEQQLLRIFISRMWQPFFLLNLAFLLFPAVNILTGKGENFLLTGLGPLIFFYGVCIAMVVKYRTSKSFRRRVMTFLLTLPLCRTLFFKLELYRFFLFYNMFLRAGIEIHASLNAIQSVLYDHSLKKSIADVLLLIERGEELVASIKKSAVIPMEYLERWELAYISGKEEAVTESIGSDLRRDIEHFLDVLTAWIPRILYFLLAIWVFWQLASFLKGHFAEIDQLTRQY